MRDGALSSAMASCFDDGSSELQSISEDALYELSGHRALPPQNRIWWFASRNKRLYVLLIVPCAVDRAPGRGMGAERLLQTLAHPSYLHLNAEEALEA